MGLEGYRETMRGTNNFSLAPTFTGIRSTGDALEWALENSGYAGFQAATTILSAGMGGLIANTVGRKALGEAVGIALNNTVQTFGSVYGDAAEEARRTGKSLDLSTMLAGATVSTAIDTLADRIGLNALSTQAFKGNALERLGKSVGTQMAVQGGTEAAQRVPEELGAGRAPFREGTGAQYVGDFAAGALFGAHVGTVGGLRGGETTGASAQPGAHRADVPLVGEQHTTPTPPVHAEQASALPEDYLPMPSDLLPDRALGGVERANPPAAQGGSELAMVSEPAAHMAQATMDPQGGAAQAEPAQEVAQPMAAAVLRMDTQPTGTLAVTGYPALIRDALLQAGVAAEDIFQGSQGALVAPRSAKRAWGILSPLAQALDAGSGRQGPVLPVASPALTPSHPGMVLLDGGSLAVTGGDPAEIVDQLLRAGIGETERLQIPGGVLVPPGSVQKVLQIFSATGAEKLVPARSGFHNGAQAFDGPPAWPMHALPPGPVFANRFPDDARELRDVPALTTDQALRMPANVLYVVKENGALIMARKPHDPGGLGDVDLARGEKVIAAGEAKVLWGTVKYIDNASGHYLPNGDAAAAAAVKAFRNHGFQVSDERYINKIFDFKSRKWVKK